MLTFSQGEAPTRAPVRVKVAFIDMFLDEAWLTAAMKRESCAGGMSSSGSSGSAPRDENDHTCLSSMASCLV